MIANHTTGASVGDRYRRKNGTITFEVIKIETDDSLARHYNFTDEIITLRRMGTNGYTVAGTALNGFRYQWVKL